MSSQRKAIERLYKGVCTIYEYQKITDPITKITSQLPKAYVIDQPCRLSYKSIPSSVQTDTIATTAQTITLFIAPEILILPGAKIMVTQNCRTTAYKQSGTSGVYTSHQEITLELYEETV